MLKRNRNVCLINFIAGYEYTDQQDKFRKCMKWKLKCGSEQFR